MRAKGNTKVCTRCHQSLPLAAFHKCKSHADGFEYACQACLEAKRQESFERYAARRHAYYLANRGTILKQSRAWGVANRTARYAASRKWIKAHPDAPTLAVNRRRARLMNAPATLTQEEWQDILATFNGHCAYCLLPFSAVRSPTMDHIKPIIHGGGHTAENVIPACRSCNSSKHTMSLLEFAAYRWGNYRMQDGSAVLKCNSISPNLQLRVVEDQAKENSNAY